MAVANRSGVPVAAEPSATVFLQVDQIDPSPQNVRREFPEAELVRLATSIDCVGLLSPIIVRPNGDRFEIVAGERRWRAVRLLGRLEIEATIRELDDREACEVGLLENLARVDLDPLERAAGFEMLISLGHSPKSVAELCTIGTPTVETSIALLKLPAWWQDRIRAGLLTQAAAEYLLPWLDFPHILRFMEPTADKWPMPLTTWGAKIVEIVMNNSRPMDAADPHGPRFEANEKLCEELQTVSVLKFALRIPRAMNVVRWDELQGAALEAEKQPLANANSQPTTASNRRPGVRKSPLNDDSPRCAEPGSESAPETPDADQWRWNFLANLIGDRLAEFDVDALDDLARQIGIDVEAEIRKAAVAGGIDPVVIGDGPDLVATIAAAG